MSTVSSSVMLMQNVCLAAVVPSWVNATHRSYVSSMLCFDETEETFVLKVDDRFDDRAMSAPYHLMACLAEISTATVPADTDVAISAETLRVIRPPIPCLNTKAETLYQALFKMPIGFCFGFTIRS